MSRPAPAEPPATVVTPALLREWPLPRPGPDSDKNERGQVLVVGGSAATPGAVLLGGIAALRAGAGKLQIATVRSVAAAVGVAVPEALVKGLPETAGGAVSADAAEDLHELAGSARAVCVGPGAYDAEELSGLLAGLLPRLDDCVVVLDALALGCVGRSPQMCSSLAGRLVLTPNADELDALLDDPASAGSRGEREGDVGLARGALAVARRFGAVVAVRGFVAAPDGRLWHDGAGSAGLGTSGSGDVLAGVVAGLAARGAAPEQAACWGVHVHGAAGDRLAARVGPLGYLARELLDEVPPVLAELQS